MFFSRLKLYGVVALNVLKDCFNKLIDNLEVQDIPVSVKYEEAISRIFFIFRTVKKAFNEDLRLYFYLHLKLFCKKIKYTITRVSCLKRHRLQIKFRADQLPDKLSVQESIKLSLGSQHTSVHASAAIAARSLLHVHTTLHLTLQFYIQQK